MLALLFGAAGSVRANGIQGIQGVAEPPTSFERFVLHDCSPCVREVHAVGVLPVPPLKLTVFPRMAAVQMTRAGQISFEVLRAYQLGRAARQRLALRVTLWVANAGEMFRMATGLLDGDDVRFLGDTIGAISRTMPIVLAPGGESVEMGFASGSLRMGVVHLRGETAGYAQAGDIPNLILRDLWEVPSTLYFSPDQLPALADMIGQGETKLWTLRGGN